MKNMSKVILAKIIAWSSHIHTALAHTYMDSLCPRHAIWRHRSGSTEAWVMVCCLTAPDHYLSQCWLFTSRAVWLISESNFHDDVIKWKHFPCYWPFVNSPHKGPWRGALIFFFDLCLNKRLSLQSQDWWFETPSHTLWRDCYVAGAYSLGSTVISIGSSHNKFTCRYFSDSQIMINFVQWELNTSAHWIHIHCSIRSLNAKDTYGLVTVFNQLIQRKTISSQRLFNFPLFSKLEFELRLNYLFFCSIMVAWHPIKQPNGA